MQQNFRRNNPYDGAEVFKKICAYCGKEFTCLKSTTLYCSHRCSNLAYKQRKREERHKAVDALFQENRNAVMIDRLNKMEFLSPSMAAIYLGLNRTTIYRYMSAGALPSVQIGSRTRIRKSDLDHLFTKSSNPWGKDRSLYYTVKEASETYGCAHQQGHLGGRGIYHLLFFPICLFAAEQPKAPVSPRGPGKWYKVPGVTRVLWVCRWAGYET